VCSSKKCAPDSCLVALVVCTSPMRYALAILMLAACGPNERPTPKQSGSVEITTWEYQNPPLQVGEVFASFFATEERRSTISTVGPCEILKLREPITGGMVDAGAITITGTREDITLTPTNENWYAAFRSEVTLFSGGEPVTISAAGGEVPAFTEVLTAPGK